MKQTLYHLCAVYGQVIDVVALKTPKMKGQAFVVFRDIPGATNAMRNIQSLIVYDKPIRVQYARHKSKATKELEKWVLFHLPQHPFLNSVASLIVPDANKRAMAMTDTKDRPTKKSKLEARLTEMNEMPQEEEAIMEEMQVEESKGNEINEINEIKGNEINEIKGNEINEIERNEIKGNEINEIERNSILFLENLPREANESMLALLFEQYAGFKEIRIVPGRPGIAFVEYENEFQAEVAKEVLDNFKLTKTNAMKVTFAKKEL
jgi:RNA recognition motif-containing protein